MNVMETASQTHAIFLQGEGEMRKLIRSKDWGETPLGEISTWPDSLLLTAAMMLDNPFAMSIFWGKEHIHLYNDAYRPMLGASKHPLALGNNVLETFSEIRDTIEPMFAEVLKGNAIRHSELELILERNGYPEKCYFNFSYSPLRDKNGNIVGILAVVVETTDGVKVRLALENSKSVLSSMIIQSPIAMAIFRGPDHIVEVANTKVLELWGKSEEESLNRPIFDVLPEAGKQGLKQLMYHVYSTGERFVANELPVALYRKGKVETVYVNFVYEPIINNNPSDVGVLSVAVDVTEQVNARKKVEEIVVQLEAANIELEKSNSALAQFAYIASHDLQEPVRKIGTFTQMLEHDIRNISEKSKGYLTKIYNSADRMSKLIRDVLAYSKVDRTEMFESVDLNDIITIAKTDFELVIDETHATVEAETLPTIKAIPSQMIQLFVNLLSNSLKYRRRGVDPVIRISAELLKNADHIKQYGLDPKKDYHHIKFSDNGIGFDKDHVVKIFRIFQRLHGRKEYEGTGIGLAICEKIASNHSGHIFAEVGENGGAIFNILLPIEISEA